MATTDQNASIYRSGSYALDITLTEEDGGPTDLTGKTVHYRVGREGESPKIALDTADLSIAANVVTVSLGTALTALLLKSSYSHELYLVASGERYVYMTGVLEVLPAMASQYPS